VRLEGGAEVLAQVVRALDDGGVAVRNIELHQPSLDDVFLSKTGRKLDVDAHTGHTATSVSPR
jgi:ABC-2 type transport system ATP-binding protein